MYQVDSETTTTPQQLTIRCELWKLLPIEKQECAEEAESKLVDVTFSRRPTDLELREAIASHFPNWTLGSWWTSEAEEVF